MKRLLTNCDGIRVPIKTAEFWKHSHMVQKETKMKEKIPMETTIE